MATCKSGADEKDIKMSMNVSFHSDNQTTFDASFIAIRSRLIRATGQHGSVDLYLSDAQARDLAETILAALAVTAAKKSEVA